ncbi:MAG TPA: hypothetical protein VKZ53_27910 [Candidatus Angelobacter sp.]|nr:hypothetical protein [Candidatus Angelobacter sp.]
MSTIGMLSETAGHPLVDAANDQQLSFEFRNISDDAGGERIIYITDDPSKNVCQFEVATSEAVTFTTSSEIRLTFSSLISKAEIEENLRVEPNRPEWKAEFKTVSRLRYWSLTPLRPMDLAPGAGLLFQIENITLPLDTSEDLQDLKIEWKIGGDFLQQNIPVLRSKPGAGSSHMRAVTFGCQPVTGQDWNVEQNNERLTIPFKQMNEVFSNLTRNLVLMSPIGFFIANTDPDQPILKKEGCRFQVSFRAGDGAQALVALNSEGQRSTDAADLEFVGSSANTRWQVTRRSEGGTSFWELTCLSPGPNFFEKGEIVSFVLKGVRANQQLGMSAIEISYLNFPGYRNGTVPVSILKVFPPPMIFEASCSPAEIFLQPDEVEVSWKTFAVTDLALEVYGVHGRVDSIPLAQANAQHKMAMAAHSFNSRMITLRMMDVSGVPHERFLAPLKYAGPWGITRWGSERPITIRYQDSSFLINLYEDRVSIVWFMDPGPPTVVLPTKLHTLPEKYDGTILVEHLGHGGNLYAHYRFHRMVGANIYELEILDPSTVGLGGSPSSLLFSGHCTLPEGEIFVPLPNLFGKKFTCMFPSI